MAFWDPISLKNIFTYIQATFVPLISLQTFVSDFYYVKVRDLLICPAYTLRAEVSLLHGFSCL